MPDRADLHRLLIRCEDRPGIVASVSGFLAARGANIIDSDQHSTDPVRGGRFFMRVEFTLPLDGSGRESLRAEVSHELTGAGIESDLFHVGDRKRIAVLTSRYEHCVLDLLWRSRRGQIDGDVVLVASNHPDLSAEVANFAIPYHHVPVSGEGKRESERHLLELLGAGRVDVVVLARYMQILSGDFLDRLGVPVINIHHSFLPAFAGANPYERARERGVKLIGATAHYVTEELDAGPIIEQDVARVRHDLDLDDLVDLGAEIERLVLARAVRWHCQDRVIRDGATTVVFAP